MRHHRNAFCAADQKVTRSKPTAPATAESAEKRVKSTLVEISFNNKSHQLR